MATYYVRKSGNDGNGGTDPDTDAWLTIDKAASTATTAGDIVYVGAGVYREQVTLDASGSSGSPISFIADVDGSQTGDGGLVIISAYTNETSAATRTTCISATAARTYNTWQGFVFTGGTTRVVSLDASANWEGMIFEDCVFISGNDDADYGLYIDFTANTTAPTNDGPIVRRCTFDGAGIIFVGDAIASEVDRKATIENCRFIGNGELSDNWAGIYVQFASSTGAHGGIAVTNCSFGAFASAIIVNDGASTTNTIDVRNSLFRSVQTALEKGTSNDGALTSDYNVFQNSASAYINVTAGGNDSNSVTDPGLIGGIADAPLYRFLGWSPFLPGEPMRTQDDSYVHAAIGLANTATAPATDFYNNPRPMHGTVDDVGAVEGRARPEQETSTVRTGSNSMRFDGAGYHDFFVPVAAQSTTITIYGRYDSSYTGSLPKMEVLNIPGVADKSDTMTGGANTWEQLTSGAFTPTGAGVCRVRISSQDTSASGQSFFDDLVVT